jgi:hypothetical protein
MPKEAKFGLVLGVSLVILIAVVFFRREAAQARVSGDAASAAAVKQPGSLPAPQPVRGPSSEKKTQERPSTTRPAQGSEDSTRGSIPQNTRPPAASRSLGSQE